MQRLLLVVVFFFLPRVAFAQTFTGQLRDGRFDHRIAADFGFHYHPTNLSVSGGALELAMFQPSVFGTFTLGRFGEGFVQFDLAWRVLGIVDPMGTDVGPADPYFGVWVGAENASGPERWRVRGGLGTVLPLISAFTTSNPDGVALVLLGMQESWQFSTDAAAVVLRVDGELRGPGYAVGADGAAAVSVPTSRDRSADERATTVMQLGVFAAGRPIPELALGSRVAVVGWDLFGAYEFASVSMTPFVRGEIGPGFLEGRVQLNLAQPFLSLTGSAPETGWSAQLVGGGTF
jgi:hypothetical protein